MQNFDTLHDYEELEEEITACLKEHRGNSSVVSTMLNTLLAWPDHPYGFGTLYGSEFSPETKCRESFVIAETVDLDRSRIYAKEKALIEEVNAQLARGRKCQVFAVYTNKHDVIERLEGLLRNEGIRAASYAPAFLLISARRGTGSNCGVGLMSRSAIPRSSRPDWTS
jgi:hypothetical protein